MTDNKPFGLLIAEKPDLMRKIHAVYEAHESSLPFRLTFLAQSGHLVALKTPSELDEKLKTWEWEDLPIEPERYGGWQYKIIKEKAGSHFQTAQERYAAIARAIDSHAYSFVINAGDPDQEGELLVREVIAYAHCTLPVYRFWTNDLTEEAILGALRNLRDDDHDEMLQNLFKAAQARQHSDYRVGMNLSRACTLKMGSRVACGRVKTPILAIVVRREDEIRHFQPQTVYGVVADYAEGFRGTLVHQDDMEEGETEIGDKTEEENPKEEKGAVWFEKPGEADEVIRALSGQDARVLSVTSRRVTRYAPKLYKLATAQMDAGRLGYDASDTLAVIQRLYEKQVLSYPRTGCEYLSSHEPLPDMLMSAASVPELAPYVAGITEEGMANMSRSSRWINDRALQEEGHSALCPTTHVPDWGSLDKAEQDIYRMICTRFVEAFLPPLLQDQTVLTARIGEKRFRSTGRTLVDAGYTVLENRKNGGMEIPAHAWGDLLAVRALNRSERTSVCPKRFTTPDLIGVCERPEKYLGDVSLKRLGQKLKIGTPATRAGIIEELIERDHYLVRTREGKSSRETVRPSETGEAIIRNLTGSAICSVDMTGEWEELLEKVRRGELNLPDLEDQMKQNVVHLLDDIRSRTMQPLPGVHQTDVIGTCPKCGGRLIRGTKQFYCSNWKAKGCRAGGFLEQYGAHVTNEEFLAMLDGQTIRKTVTWKGQSWEQPMRCDADGRIECIREEKPTNWTCPVCGKPIRKTPSGYACAGVEDKSCGVALRFMVCGIMITEEEWNKLFTTGQTDVLSGFYSEKKKTKFDARLAAVRGANGLGTVGFRFEDPGEPSPYDCPVCGNRLTRHRWRYVCEHCHFQMPRLIGKRELDDRSVQALIQAVRDGSISGGAEALIGSHDLPTPYTCPVCGRGMMRNGLWTYCTGHADKSCEAGVYRFLSGRVLTEAEMDTLLRTGHTPELGGFRSTRTGREFSAPLVFDKAHPSGGFDFGENTAGRKNTGKQDRRRAHAAGKRTERTTSRHKAE